MGVEEEIVETDVVDQTTTTVSSRPEERLKPQTLLEINACYIRAKPSATKNCNENKWCMYRKIGRRIKMNSTRNPKRLFEIICGTVSCIERRKAFLDA